MMYVNNINPGFSNWASTQANMANAWQSGITNMQTGLTGSPVSNAISYSFNPAGAVAANSAMGLYNNALYNQGFSGQNAPWLQQGFSGQINPMVQQGFSGQINPMMQQGLSAVGQAQGLNAIQSSAGLAQPRVDLAETNTDIVVAAELPNINLNDLNLTVTDDSITISATAFSGGNATSLFRTVALPTSIRAERVDASYNNGILEVRLPKSDVATRRKLKVNVIGQ